MKPARHREFTFEPFDSGSISNYEAKFRAAEEVAALAESGQVIGAGSGSTAFLAVRAIASRVRHGELHDVRLIPTSIESELTITGLGLAQADLSEVAPDWLFDGADEVDSDGNLIKGRGGALFREKLLFSACQLRRVLIDPSKRVERLGKNFPVPVEVVPRAASVAMAGLKALGADEIALRTGSGKDGPVLTEQGNLLLDCHFESIDEDLEDQIKLIVGVLDSGLFQGYGPEVISA
ncbi:MAG: ribose 5-phosphate isomerase A [Solirubrobacterales bacterium]|nr:ribose 5-phosphate isomerase A [Solirubrobacterales bacterium]